ncbi:MAG: acyl-CoA dehydrogenase family protein [Nitrospirae bacterium]|nr:acyl-CoA dehydrogenase family protein [Nitrospirota bacterium]
MGITGGLDEALRAAESACREALAHLARLTAKNGEVSNQELDRHQIAAYDLAFLMAELHATGHLRRHAGRLRELRADGNFETAMADTMAAETVHDIRSKLSGRPQSFGPAAAKAIDELSKAPLSSAVAEAQDPSRYTALAIEIRRRGDGGTYGLSEEQQLMRDSFRRFAETKVRPVAEKTHREDHLIPESIIAELSEMGCFGLSIPQRFGGFQSDEKPDNMGMVIVTEELSRGSLGVAGSLITRPEILAKALLKGGTAEQKEKWLPQMAAGKKMVAVGVTEPDFGSDVAGMKCSATRAKGGWLLDGAKTWCTFAGRAELIMVLARTDPDLSKKHRGLSVFVVEKPPFEGHNFEHRQEGGGRLAGRAIGTIGYRGMHSYELHFENFLVPEDALVGGEQGLGKGFYLQMEGFAGGRLQTAARANGVMQAAFEKALAYAQERKVFGRPILDFPLTQHKLARMAMLIQASRQFTYAVARMFDEGKGQMEGSTVKFFASKIAEWVCREAMQIHGGMGYAEEYDVSRYFVDARVFSIFEGAEEVLALRVVARSLIEQAAKEAA